MAKPYIKGYHLHSFKGTHVKIVQRIIDECIRNPAPHVQSNLAGRGGGEEVCE